jgi:hypothetical protein
LSNKDNYFNLRRKNGHNRVSDEHTLTIRAFRACIQPEIIQTPLFGFQGTLKHALRPDKPRVNGVGFEWTENFLQAPASTGHAFGGPGSGCLQYSLMFHKVFLFDCLKAPVVTPAVQPLAQRLDHDPHQKQFKIYPDLSGFLSSHHPKCTGLLTQAGNIHLILS